MCLFFNLDVAQTAGPMLVEVGRHNAAAQLYMGVEMIKEAVDAFISAEEWNKVLIFTQSILLNFTQFYSVLLSFTQFTQLLNHIFL